MSRIIVKNLPNKVTKEQVTKHFSKAGTITDVNLKYNEKGEFRGFCFIGFESEAFANEALYLFHKTHFKNGKIIVEKCKDLDKENKVEKNSKYNEPYLSLKEERSDFKNAIKKKDDFTKQKLETLMKNPNFINYLKMNKRGTADLVDTLQKKYGSMKELQAELEEEEEDGEKEKETEEEVDVDDETEQQHKDKLANRNISDVEYLRCLMKTSENKEKNAKKWEELFTVVIRTKKHQTDKEKKDKTPTKRDVKDFVRPLTKRGVKDFLRPLTIQSLRIPRKMSYVAYVGFKTEKAMNNALQKDNSFIDDVQVRVHKHEDRNSSGDPVNKELPWQAAEDKLLKEAKPVIDSGKLFVRNLWYSVTESDLRELFEKIGPLADVTLPISQLTRRPKGFAHVTFVFPEHAVKAMNELDQKDFKGRVMHILPSLDKEGEENETEGGTSYQKRKKEEQKKKANSWHNWNSLFISSEAVIDIISSENQISKYKMLDDDESSAAVSMAVSEAQMVEETKRMLEENGVCLSAFTDSSVQRSSTVILSKNLPAKTSAVELRQIFGKFGDIGRVVLPPSGVTAVIEFLEESEAKKAFRKLAYTRFKDRPLYLEWAPVNVFTSKAIKKPVTTEETKNENDEESTKTEERKPEDNTTLYVKNLNFKTDEETLKQHFSRVGDICSVMIAKQRALSQGYGFVQFFKTSDAEKALKTLQNTTLDGFALTIKKSEKKLVSQEPKFKMASPGEPITAKILIKNIPFQATYKEIKELFESAGQVKLLRLPNKFGTSEHRGFGFIEFMTKEQAKKAMLAFGASTHLYGRRLVLEWANEDETVEQLRSKTARKFLATGSPKKKIKMDDLAS